MLLGIPRYVSSGRARAKREGAASSPAGGVTAAADELDVSAWTPSTNLAEISDWLMKLLLGAGLVELTWLGGPTSRLVRTIASGLDRPAPGGDPSGSAIVMAGAILVLFPVLGFLVGYMLTTLWYRHALVEDGGGNDGVPADPTGARSRDG